MQQGRQECRPSDGPATLLSPIRRTGDAPVADGGHEGVLRLPTTTLSRSHETASASRWGAWKSGSSCRGQNLFWWVGSHAAGATRVSPIRRTGDTPVADGGHEGVLRSLTTHPLALSRNSFCKSLVKKESCFFPSGPKLVLVGRLPSKCQRSLVSRSSVIVGESQVRIHQTQIEPGPLGLLDSFVVGILFSKSVHDGPARNEHFSANHRRRSRSPAHGFIRYVKKSRSAASSIPASNPSGIRETGSAVRLAVFPVRAPCIWPARSRTVAPCAPCFTSSPSRVSPLVNVSV
ncbi:MAG: hypothetical protein RL077_5858 [Verrucomicrobiota bacterium]